MNGELADLPESVEPWRVSRGVVKKLLPPVPCVRARDQGPAAALTAVESLQRLNQLIM
jgi:hypothetical protein